MKNMRKVHKNCTGFSLGETLVAVAILVIITAASLPAAVHVYRNAVDAANAQVLLSTTVNALRDELSTAWDVKADSAAKEITYKSSDIGSQSKIKLGKDDTSTDTILLEEYSKPAGADWLTDVYGTVASRPLVSREMRRTTRDGSSYQNGYVTFSGLQVKRDGTVIAKMPDTGLLIRVMTADETSSQTGGGGT